MSEQKKRDYAFGPFRLDACKRLLFHADQLVPLTPRAFDTLLVLVENGGKVMTKEELMRSVWADDCVEENNLAQSIHAIRKTLGDWSSGVKYVETISKRGYRFIASVEVLTDPTSPLTIEDGSGQSGTSKEAKNATNLQNASARIGHRTTVQLVRKHNTQSAQAT